MTDKEFEQRLRDLCLGHAGMQVPDVWDGIERKLARKRRLVLWRRIGISAAAAAVIAVGFIATEKIDSNDVYQEFRTEVQKVADAEPVRSVEPAEDAVTVVPVAPVRTLADDLNALSDRAVADVPTREESAEVVVVEEVVVEEKGDQEPVSVGGYDTSDYLAFAEESSVNDSRLSLSASSDFSTIYGSGNVSFAGKSMSGGSSGGGLPDIKPLAGSSPSHSLPLSAGLTVQYGFGPANSFGQHRFGVGVGINYTYLRSTYDALVCKEYLGKYGSGSEQASVSQNVHYLGIPVSFYVNILTTDKLFFYASAGGEVEKGIQLQYKFTDLNGVTSGKSMAISGVQWSVNLGLGFEYKFVKFMGVYVDPRLTYYFDCNQPYSLREEQRLQMNIGLGFRFHF